MDRLYFDTCVWCRPFDSPTSSRIVMEAQALHRILSLADEGKIEIVGSGVVLFEASMISESGKRDAALALIRKSVTVQVDVNEEIQVIAKVIMGKCGLSDLDAAHVATAIESGADFFLTTDDDILDRGGCVSEFGIIVKNPLDYRLVQR